MSDPLIPLVDAELALAEVRARREQVVDTNLVPAWFWGSVGVLMLLFVAGIESRRAVFVGVGTAAYAIGLSTLVLMVVRHVRVQVRPQLLGVRGAVSIAVFALGLVAVGISLGLVLDAAGAPWPATIACAPVAAGMAFGGPVLMSYLRRVMLSRPLGGDR